MDPSSTVVQDAGGQGEAWSDKSYLDQGVPYPPEFAGIPASTPNTNMRRKSRRSWFEKTPVGSKLEIAVEKDAPKVIKATRESDEMEVLTLTHFTAPPRIGFGKMKPGQVKSRTLLLRNPHDYAQTVKVEKVPEKRKFSVSDRLITVGPLETHPLVITWSPTDEGNFREMILMQVDGSYRLQTYVFGSVAAPVQRKKTRRGGLLATKVSRPFSVIHTSSLANIDHNYSPEKKSDTQSKVSKNRRSIGKQAKVVKFTESRRRSLRLKSAETCNNENDHESKLMEVVVSENKQTCSRNEDGQKIPKKKMRRSNTYSNVSGLGLTVPIIDGDTVQGHTSTLTLNVSGILPVESSPPRVLNSGGNVDFTPDFAARNGFHVNNVNLEPSFLSEADGAATKVTSAALEPSFIETEKVGDTNTIQQALVNHNMNTIGEPSFLETSGIKDDDRHTTKYVPPFNVRLKSETFCDSLENTPIGDIVKNIIEQPSFLTPDTSLDNSYTARLRNNIVGREIVSPDSFVREMSSAKKKMERSQLAINNSDINIAPSPETVLNQSVPHGIMMEQLKGVKTNLQEQQFDKQLDNSNDSNSTNKKRSAIGRRETFVNNKRQSPRLASQNLEANTGIRRGTFVSNAKKVKLLETQKPSEASPRRTTFTVIKKTTPSRTSFTRKAQSRNKKTNVPKTIDIETNMGLNDSIVKFESEKPLPDRLDAVKHVTVTKSKPDVAERTSSTTSTCLFPDSLDNNLSVKSEFGSPCRVQTEPSDIVTCRATLTITKSEPSEALLENSNLPKSSAVALNLLSTSPEHAPTQDGVYQHKVNTCISPIPEADSPNDSPTDSKNGTFDVSANNNRSKDSSFHITPYSRLPMSPNPDNSRRSTRVVEKPKVIGLHPVDRKQLFSPGAGNCGSNLNQYAEQVKHDLIESPVAVDECESIGSFTLNKQTVNGNKGTDDLDGNLISRATDAKLAVNVNERENSKCSPTVGLETGNNQNEPTVLSRNTRHRKSGRNLLTNSNKLPTPDSDSDKRKNTPDSDKLYFVPLDKQPVKETVAKSVVKPVPHGFLKKRSSAVVQSEDRTMSKRPRSESDAVGSKSRQPATGHSELGMKTRQGPTQATRRSASTSEKPSRSVTKPKPSSSRGLPPSKLILVKKPKTALPKHPLPFAARNMYYDERWMEKQERGFVNWLNFILTPAEEYQSSNVKVKVDAGKLRVDVAGGNVKLAPTNEVLSFRAYSARRKLNRLRRSACQLFQSESVVNVIRKIELEVDNERLLVRKDRMLHADLGMKQKILDMLLSYNPLWLRVGMETIFGEVLPLQSNSDVVGLSRFILTRLLGNPDIEQEYSHPTVPHLYRDGYAAAVAQHTLKKFLLLVYFLDQGKQRRLIEHNPCLFCKDSDFKTSKDLLLQLSRDYLAGEGDITRHLGYLGYKTIYTQTALDEFDFAVSNLATDLRDGLRLTRVLECLCDKPDLSRTLRVPAISRLQKIHNMEVVFKLLAEQGLKPGDDGKVTVRDIVDGHRERTLQLLWTIILHYQVDVLLDVDQLREEVAILERSLKLQNQLSRMQNNNAGSQRMSSGPDLHTQNERLQLLMQWCRAVCAFYNIQIENFTVSFSDGRALCHIVHHYHPALVVRTHIRTDTTITHMEEMEERNERNAAASFNDSCDTSSVFGGTEDPAIYERLLNNEKDNFKLLFAKVTELGGVPLMLKHSDMSNTIPDEKVTVTYLLYLCARLLDIRHESRAARVIQLAWRHHRLRKYQRKLKVKTAASSKIQRAVREFLCRRWTERRDRGAVTIQRVWRGHMARTLAENLRRDRRLARQINAVKQLQNAVRSWLQRRRNRQTKAAVMIQTCFRGYLARSWVARLQKACTTVQNRWRATLVARLQRKEYQKLRAAAIFIQSRQRMCVQRRYFRQTVEKITKIQSCVRMLSQRRAYTKRKTSITTVQKWWRGIQTTRLARREYVTMKTSALTIQSVWRQYLERRRYREMCAARTIQSTFRGFIQRQMYKEKRHNIITVQSAVRCFLARKSLEELRLRNVAAQLIQERWRAVMAGRQQRQLYLELKQAAIILQMAYRARGKMLVAQRQFLIVKGAAMTIQALYRGHVVRKCIQTQTAAATAIQSWWRALLAMKEQRYRFLEMRGAAIAMQSAWRGYLARKHYREIRGAVVIQSAYRGYRQRHQYLCTRMKVIMAQSAVRRYFAAKLLQKLIHRNNAAKMIQQKWRAYKVGCYQHRMFLDTKRAAVVLQSAFRARRAMLVAQRRFLIQKGAAMTIQAVYRGHRVRREMERRSSAAIVIQSNMRGNLERRRFLALKHAVIVCQRQFRAVTVGKHDRKQYLRLRESVIMTQARCRGANRRREFTKIRRSAVVIQAWWRGVLETRQCRREYREVRSATVSVQALCRGYLARKWYRRLCAAHVIQAVYRGYRQRRQYQAERSKIILAQSVVRRYLAIKLFTKMKHHHEAAVVIQQRWRAFCAGQQQRREFLQTKHAAVVLQTAFRARLQMLEAQRQFLICKGAAITIQAFIRGHLVRRVARQQNAAATVIQSLVRRYLEMRKYVALKNMVVNCQRRFRAMKAGKQERESYLHLKAAVVVSQAHCRGSKCCRDFVKQRQTAMVIQKWWRSVLESRKCQREYQTKKAAIVTLQASWRGYVARKQCSEVRAARVIQSTYRGYRQRQCYISMRNRIIVVQSAVRRYLATRLRRKLELRRQAAKVIQTRWRANKLGQHQRRQFLDMKHAAVVLQSVYRARLQMLETQQQFLICKGAAIIIQAFIRGHLVRRVARQQNAAATVIQSLVRRYLERRKYVTLKNMVVNCQRRFRAMKAGRQERENYLHLKAAVVVSQAHCSGSKCRRDFVKQRQTAMVVQKWWRSVLETRKCQREYQTKKAATIALQASWRGYLARKQCSEVRAARVIQSTYRGYRQRQCYISMRNRIIVVQSAVRRYLATRLCRKLELRRQAAKVIQTRWRANKLGQHKRRQFLDMKHAAVVLQSVYRARLQMLEDRRQFMIYIGAVITIQAVYRGHMARKQARRENTAATLIQSLVRRFIARSKFLVLKNSVLNCQQHVRANKAGKLARDKYQNLKTAVLVSQACYRGAKCCREFLKMRKSVVFVQTWWRSVIETRNCQRQYRAKQAAIVRLQTACRIYLMMKHHEQTCAARVIQSAYRGYQQRKMYRSVRGKIIMAQSAVRRYLATKVVENLKRRNRAAILLQQSWRAYRAGRQEQREFLRVKHSAMVIQLRYRAWQKMEAVRHRFLVCKGAAITIQAAYRGYAVRTSVHTQNHAAVRIQTLVRGYLEQQRFLKLKSAVISCQRSLRLQKLGRAVRHRFLICKGAAITIQAAYRGYALRTYFHKQNHAAVRIQTLVRGYLERQRFLKLKSAVISCQRRLRLQKLGRTEREKYVLLKKSATTIQSYLRMFRERKTYRRVTSAIMLIQSHIRTWNARKEFIRLQEKRRRARESHVARVVACARIHLAAMAIQHYYRNHRLLQGARERLHSVLLLQHWMRGRLQRLRYLRDRRRIVRVQAVVRSWLSRRQRAACVIQCAARKWLVKRRESSYTDAVVRIQSRWRGYRVRNSLGCRKVRTARRRIQAATAAATDDRKLCNRTTSALDYLLRYKHLSQVLDALMHLDVATRLSAVCCERMVEVNAVGVLYRLARGCNRSIPHMELIKYTVNVLLNLAKYEKTRPALYQEEEGLATLVELMQIYREKGPIFVKACTLMGILALDTRCKMAILGDKKTTAKLKSIQTLTSRKHKIDENLRITRSKMNATFNTTMGVRSPVKKHKIKPDWSLHRDRMRDIDNPLKAINFVIGNLGLQGS